MARSPNGSIVNFASSQFIHFFYGSPCVWLGVCMFFSRVLVSTFLDDSHYGTYNGCIRFTYVGLTSRFVEPTVQHTVGYIHEQEQLIGIKQCLKCTIIVHICVARYCAKRVYIYGNINDAHRLCISCDETRKAEGTVSFYRQIQTST